MAQPNAPLCRCDCGLFMSDDSASSITLDLGWTKCECRFCGTHEGCTVACSEVLRYTIAVDRGKGDEFSQACPSLRGSEDLTDSFKASHPKFCADCMEHGLLQLKLDAVLRARKRREEFSNVEKPVKAAGLHGSPK